MDFKTIAAKKVAGVPVLYVGAGLVTILGVYAFKMKPSASLDAGKSDTPAEDTSLQGAANDAATDAYSGLKTGGTVIVQPRENQVDNSTTPEVPTTTPSDTSTTPTVATYSGTGKYGLDGKPKATTNSQWIYDGALGYNREFGASVTVTQALLNKYVAGSDMSYAESAVVDHVLATIGPPPDGTSGSGKIGTAPAQKQFSLFPGKHTVKGDNDNNATKLSTLYYGVADYAHLDKIASVNTNLGPKSTTYSVGTVVNIPAYVNPSIYTVKAGDGQIAAIAAKNGLSVAHIGALNPTVSFGGTIPVGTRLRVR